MQSIQQSAAPTRSAIPGQNRAGRQPLELAKWPFWKTVPRFTRESTTGDFLDSALSLLDSVEAPTGLERYFAAACSVKSVRTGREGLYLILQALGLPRGSRVGVPLYCCDAVFLAIAAAGYVPIFLDIDLDSYSLDPQSLWRNRETLDALIVVHTFGYPANLARIQECLGDRDIPVIEDCAHSLFSDYLGMPTGSWTQAAFLTFGPHKPAAAGGGGILVINNPAVASRIEFATCSLEKPGKAEELRHAARSWVRGLGYKRGTYGALLAITSSEKRESRVNEAEHRAMTEGYTALKVRGMRRVDRILVGERVRRFKLSLPALAINAAAIRFAAADVSLCYLEEPVHGSWNHFMVPVRYGSEALREAGRRFLRRHRVDTAALYGNCVRNAAFYGYRGGCPNAELASRTVCTIPNHAWLSKAEMQHVCDALRRSATALKRSF